MTTDRPAGSGEADAPVACSSTTPGGTTLSVVDDPRPRAGVPRRAADIAGAGRPGGAGRGCGTAPRSRPRAVGPRGSAIGSTRRPRWSPGRWGSAAGGRRRDVPARGRAGADGAVDVVLCLSLLLAAGRRLRWRSPSSTRAEARRCLGRGHQRTTPTRTPCTRSARARRASVRLEDVGPRLGHVGSRGRRRPPAARRDRQLRWLVRRPPRDRWRTGMHDALVA
jgi:hypothetical protein